jgi:hypothetical protein
VVNGRPGFETKILSTVITNSDAGTITVEDEIVDSLGTPLVAVGDWVAPAGMSPIPQIPVEAHRLLVQSAVAKTLMAMGDDRWQHAEQKYQLLAKQIMTMLAPRVDDSPKKLKTNGRGIWDMRWRNWRYY